MANSPTIKRIAMWSGPRNISTAMMRSWGNRQDTFVTDEPLYAHYLLKTKLPHPGAEDVIAHHESDWRTVVAWLTGPIPQPSKSIWYQKHMSHHLLPEIERGWLDAGDAGGLTHAFLIREPREMLTSLIKNIPQPTLSVTGLPQQVVIFEHVWRMTGCTAPPPVIDSRDVLQQPRVMLSALCKALDVQFDEAMLSWPPGCRATDGIWAGHWYASVEQSTKFESYKPMNEPLPAALEPLLSECEAIYAQLHAVRLQPTM